MIVFTTSPFWRRIKRFRFECLFNGTAKRQKCLLLSKTNMGLKKPINATHKSEQTEMNGSRPTERFGLKGSFTHGVRIWLGGQLKYDKNTATPLPVFNVG